MPARRMKTQSSRLRSQLRLELLESLDVASTLATTNLSLPPPVAASAAEPSIRVSETTDSSSEAESDDDGDSAKYSKSSKQSSTVTNDQSEYSGQQLVSGTVGQSDHSVEYADSATKSSTSSPSYSRVSPVLLGPERADETRGRTNLTTVNNSQGNSELQLNPEEVSYPNSPTARAAQSVDYRVLISTITFEKSLLRNTPDELENGPRSSPSGIVEARPATSLPDPSPLKESADTPVFPFTLDSSIIVGPIGWAAATTGIRRVLDVWSSDLGDPESIWQRAYFWGAIAAGSAIGIELTRRYAHTTRTRELENWYR